MKPYLAIAALAVIAGASVYVLDGFVIATKVIAITLLVPCLFLAGYRHWMSKRRQ
jgi:hypothetical protein